MEWRGESLSPTRRTSSSILQQILRLSGDLSDPLMCRRKPLPPRDPEDNYEMSARGPKSVPSVPVEFGPRRTANRTKSALRSPRRGGASHRFKGQAACLGGSVDAEAVGEVVRELLGAGPFARGLGCGRRLWHRGPFGSSAP